MNYEDRLASLAGRYRNLGFEVVAHPGPDDLPPFAKGFGVEIVARKEGGAVLAVAKASPSELEADPRVARYAEIVSEQPGWRLDVFILGPDINTHEKTQTQELSEEQMRVSLMEVEQILRAGFADQSLVAAWALLEAAMRRRLRGERADRPVSSRTMLNELYSCGVVSTEELRRLEALSRHRDAIAHGFRTEAVGEDAIRFLVRMAKELLGESRAMKQIA